MCALANELKTQKQISKADSCCCCCFLHKNTIRSYPSPRCQPDNFFVCVCMCSTVRLSTIQYFRNKIYFIRRIMLEISITSDHRIFNANNLILFNFLYDTYTLIHPLKIAHMGRLGFTRHPIHPLRTHTHTFSSNSKWQSITFFPILFSLSHSVDLSNLYVYTVWSVWYVKTPWMPALCLRHSPFPCTVHS